MQTSFHKQSQANKRGEANPSKKKHSVNAVINFEDKRSESLAQSTMQSAANESLQAKTITQFREIAEGASLQQELPVQKKAISGDSVNLKSGSVSMPVVQRVFDAWVVEAIMDSAAAIAAELRNPPHGKTAWHVMLDHLQRLGIANPAAADVQPLMQAIYTAVPEPVAAASSSAVAKDERMTDDVAAKVAATNGWTAVSGQVGMDKRQDEAGKKHAPKGRVFTDGKGNFWGADNTMHASGAHWKYWTGSQKSLVYKGNVTNDAPYTPVERGAQRTVTKKEKASAAAAKGDDE